jgi:hypothetical protein
VHSYVVMDNHYHIVLKINREQAQNDVHPDGIPFHLKDYLELVDWTGRVIREDKRGAIPTDVPPILKQLNINPKVWLIQTQHFGSIYSRFAGARDSLKTKVDSKMGKWFKGAGLEKRLGLAVVPDSH